MFVENFQDFHSIIFSHFTILNDNLCHFGIFFFIQIFMNSIIQRYFFFFHNLIIFTLRIWSFFFDLFFKFDFINQSFIHFSKILKFFCSKNPWKKKYYFSSTISLKIFSRSTLSFTPLN